MSKERIIEVIVQGALLAGLILAMATCDEMAETEMLCAHAMKMHEVEVVREVCPEQRTADFLAGSGEAPP